MSIGSHQPPVAIGRVLYFARAAKLGEKHSLMSMDQFSQAVAALWALMREGAVSPVLVGGLALLQYVSGRNTEDIDIILAASALARLPELSINERNESFAQAVFQDLRLNILLTDNPLFALVERDHTTERDFAGETIRCATVEGLLLLKLYALPSLYRSGDFARVGLYENDIATLMQAYRPLLPPLLETLGQMMSASDRREIERIVGDLQRRIDRFEAHQRGEGS